MSFLVTVIFLDCDGLDPIPYVETEPLSITFLTLFKTQDTIPMY